MMLSPLRGSLSKNGRSISTKEFNLENILDREQIEVNYQNLSSLIKGKSVMITGAGGSIGSEIARQLLGYHPGKIILVERAEFALFSIDWELRQTANDFEIKPLLLDIRDETALKKAFAKHPPQIIFHAAAHKHVPLMEEHPVEALKNNSLATGLLAELAGKFAVETFIFVSTDKAVKPVSVMGASKRLAEMIVQNYNKKFSTKYISVRFGNVLGSAGSVVPVFLEQIRRGGPVTVTHPQMMRYFMTIQEAVCLVIEAGAMGKGGEIFSLNLGNPLQIVDLAKKIIEKSGYIPGENMEIVFSGTRPGEKITEEPLLTGEEQKTEHPQIFINLDKKQPEEHIEKLWENLKYWADKADDEQLKALMLGSCQSQLAQAN